jgi:hypothetical protein
MFSYVSLEQWVPMDHPLRGIRKLTDGVLGSLSPEFYKLYTLADLMKFLGRFDSISPE